MRNTDSTIRELKALNPRLVYCSITGFGQDGPYASRPGYDFMIQGMSGLMSVTGEPGGNPLKVGVALADLIAGHVCEQRDSCRTDVSRTQRRGQHIDIALLDTMVAALANQALNYL